MHQGVQHWAPSFMQSLAAPRKITEEPLSDRSSTFVESRDSSVPETRHKQAIHHQPGCLGQTGKTVANMPMKGPVDSLSSH